MLGAVRFQIKRRTGEGGRMITKERLADLMQAGKVVESDMKKTLKQLPKNLPDYKNYVLAYKDRLLINQILEVYRDLRNINTHEEIQIILDRVNE